MMPNNQLTNAQLNRQAFSNALTKKRTKKSGKRLYLSAIHKRINKDAQAKRLAELMSQATPQND